MYRINTIVVPIPAKAGSLQPLQQPADELEELPPLSPL